MRFEAAGVALIAAAAAALPALSQPAQEPAPSEAAAAPQWELSAGGDYSAGRYGAASDTQVSDVRINGKAQFDRLRLEAVLPYVTIEGPGELVSGVPVSSGGSAVSKRSGLGDLSLSAAYRVGEARANGPALELGGTFKVPTAKAGIGTKKADYGLAANLYGNFTPKLSWFGSLGYSWLGDSSVYDLRNGVAGYVGANLAPTPERNLGFSLAYRARAAAGLDPQLSFNPYLTQRFAKDWGVTLYATAGMTSASPRLGAGLSLSWFR